MTAACGIEATCTKKCFWQSQGALFGASHLGQGILQNPEKISAVKRFSIPTSVKTVRQFLGLGSYYRHFVPNFARVANSLYALTRQDVPFQWTPACQQSFEILKDLLTTTPVLAYPDFTKEFELHTDARGEGVGAILEQVQEDGQLHPVAYASRSINKHEKCYGVTELEALAVVWAVKHFQSYLIGQKCTVYTDHAPLRSMLQTRHQSGNLARWACVLAEVDLEIRYRPGRKNATADVLSRAPLRSANDDCEGQI